MWFDDNGVVFNPFMIGQPEDAKPYEYKQPTYVTYPPYATWPTEHSSKSVSKSTLLAQEEAEERSRHRETEQNRTTSRSQVGEVTFSKAIKEEMEAAKQTSADEQRIYAGGASKTDCSEPSVGSGTVRTLLAVRSPRSPSQTSVPKSVSSRVKAGDRQSSKLSMQSHTRRTTDSTVTLKDAKQLHTEADTDMYNYVSHPSLRSMAKEYTDDDTKHRSVMPPDDEKQWDKVSSMSARSHASRTSNIRPKAGNAQKDTSSRVSIRSKTTERQAESISRTSQAGDGKKANKPPKSLGTTRESLQEVAESIQRQLAKSLETTKSLSIKAAELSERLKAGNEFNHNRVHTLARQFTHTEPLKRCRDDRMTFWFKDAVLS